MDAGRHGGRFQRCADGHERPDDDWQNNGCDIHAHRRPTIIAPDEDRIHKDRQGESSDGADNRGQDSQNARLDKDHAPDVRTGRADAAHDRQLTDALGDRDLEGVADHDPGGEHRDKREHADDNLNRESPARVVLDRAIDELVECLHHVRVAECIGQVRANLSSVTPGVERYKDRRRDAAVRRDLEVLWQDNAVIGIERDARSAFEHAHDCELEAVF